MFNQIIDTFIDFLQLLSIPKVGFLHAGPDGWTFIMCILEGLIFHLNGDVGFFEKGKCCIIDTIFSLAEVD